MGFGLGKLNPVRITSRVVQQVGSIAKQAVNSPFLNPIGVGIAEAGFSPAQLKNPKAAVISLVNNPLVNPVGVGIDKVTGISPEKQIVAGAVIGATVVAAPVIGTVGTAVKTAALAKALTDKPEQPASLAPVVAPAPAPAPNAAKAGLWLAGAVALLQLL